MNRGDIYWVNLNPTKGSEINKKRPCIIISPSAINRARSTVIIVPLSTARTRPPIVISIECLGQKVSAICDQIRAVDKSRLNTSAIDRLPQQDIDSLDDSLRQILTL